MFRTTRLFALAVALLAGVAAASGAVVNVEFNDLANPASFSGNAGAAPDPLGTHYWNQFNMPASWPATFTTATSFPLRVSDGSTHTGVRVTLSRTTGNGISAHNDLGYAGGFAEELLGGYVLYGSGDGGGPIDLSIDGLIPGNSYDIYVYAQGGHWTNYGASTTIGATTKETQPTINSSFVEGDNYVLFSSIAADGGGGISATCAPQSTQLDEANVNGLQVVGEFAPFVPEPGTGIINVDLNAIGSATYAGQGAYPEPGNDFWNGLALGPNSTARGDGVDVTSGPLIESDGVTVSDVTVTITGGDVVVQAPAPFAPDLFDDFSYGDNGENPSYPAHPVSFSIDNLVVDALYDIYVYAGGGRWTGYGSQITIGGEAKVTDYPGSLAFLEGENYVVFRNVLAIGGTITGTSVGAPGGNPEGEGDLNGFTIVAVIIPEPGTGVLLALGFLAALPALRRRPRRS